MDERLKTNIIVLYTILLFLFIGIIIGLINHHNWIHPLTQPTEDAEENAIVGFWINDIYNTCMYVDSEEGIVFDGYCYNTLKKPNQVLEACITGCKLGVPYGEDESNCLDLCKRYMLEKHEINSEPIRTTAEPVRVGKAVCKESSSCIQELINNQEWIDRILVEESKGKSFSKLDDYAQSSVLFLARETCYVDECIKPQSQAKELG